MTDHIDVLYIHPGGNQADFNIPMGLIGMMNSIQCQKLGIMYYEVTQDLIERAKIIVMDCHWYTSLAGMVELADMIKNIDSQKIIIIGGYTASIFAESIVQECNVDYVIRGDAEHPFVELIGALLAGESPRNVPNIATSNYSTGRTYVLNVDDYSDTDYITIDWFPTFHERIRLVHAQHPFMWDETLGLHPFIPIFKGCYHDCGSCYADKTLNRAMHGRDIVARKPESVIADLIACSENPEISQAYTIADFIDVLGLPYAKEIFSNKYDLNFFYSFCYSGHKYVNANVLDLIVSSFNKCGFYFVFSDYYHSRNARDTFHIFEKSLSHLKTYGTDVNVYLHVLKGNPIFYDYYDKLLQIYERLELIDHSVWFIEIPHPETKRGMGSENNFAYWLRKSNRDSVKNYIDNLKYRDDIPSK